MKFTVDAYPGDLFDGNIFEIRMNSTTTQNVVTYPVIIEAKNPQYEIDAWHDRQHFLPDRDERRTCLRLPAALRFIPQPSQVRPEDRHLVELPTSSSEGTSKRTASEKAEQSRKSHRRHVWVQDGPLLRAVPSHPWVDGKPIRGNTGRRPQRRPGRRDRDGSAAMRVVIGDW